MYLGLYNHSSMHLNSYKAPNGAKIALVAAFCFLFWGSGKGQVFTYIDSSNTVNCRFAQFDLQSCMPVDTIQEWVGLEEFWDISYHPTFDRLYYFAKIYPTPSGWWPDPTIWSMDYPNAPISSIVNPGAPDTVVRGIIAYFDDKIYMAGKGLSTFLPFMNPLPDGAYEYLGDLPAGMECAGGLTFRHDTLYLSTANNTLVRVDLEDLSQSEEVFAFPPGTLPILGLSTLYYDCDSLETFAMGTDFATQQNAIYRVDFANQTLEEVCTSNIPMRGGIASPLSVTLPPCDLIAGLDWDGSSGAGGFDFLADTFCLGSSPIADADLEILSEMNRIDSIHIRLLDVQDGLLESLVPGSLPASIQVASQGPFQLILRNTGAATVGDFVQAIQNITYEHLGAMPTAGTRRVRFRLYSWCYESEHSFAYLPLYNTTLQLPVAIDPASCWGQSDGSIALGTPAGGAPPYVFEWANGSADTVLNNLPAGIYTLELSDSEGCMRAFTYQILQPDTLLLQLLNSGPPWVCDTFGLISASAQGGNGGYSYLWNTGAGGAQQTGLPPGLYEATVTDSKGCTAEASLSLEEMSYQSADTAVICQGESYPFEGQLFFSDTSWCQTLLTAGGCDSLRCLELTVRDTFFSLETAQICAGQAYAFQGQSFAADTFFCAVFSSQHGCDSTACLSLEVIDTPNAWTVSGTLCNGQPATLSPSAGFAQYQWSGGSDQPQLQVFEGGWYFVTLTDGAGCVKTDSVWVEDESFEVLPQSSAPSCPGLDDGMIDAGTIAGGAAPFSFSVNGGGWQVESQFVSLPPGGYTVAVQDAKGCLWTEAIYLSAPPPFWVSLGPDQSVAFGEPVTIGVTASDPLALLSWLPPAPCADCWELTYQPLVTETLSVALISASGCQAADTVQIQVRQPDQWLYLPNIFSPNADGVNDAWEAHAGPAVRQFLSLKVFSRWGDQIYTREGPAQRMVWDGTSQGKPVPAGVYVCLLEYELISGERRTEAVQVTVVR